MDIDIIQYRAAIVSFTQKGYFSRKSYNKKSKVKTINQYFKHIKILLIILNIFALFQLNQFFHTSKSISIA